MLRTFLICMGLMVVTCAVYWQVGSHEFLTYDDDLYIRHNPQVAQGITGANIIWAFTSVEQCNWHPVTWLSHMLDVQLYGMNPRGHHLTNVVIHCFTTLLLFFLLFRITGAIWQSSFVAALFALHPLHVESVAWAAERKDVLCALFWFLTLSWYARYVEKRRSTAGFPLFPYLLALLSFLLGLMSKPMIVTLPVVMLLLDYWPLRRDSKLSGLMLEKIPFFICSALSSAITIHAQRTGGAIVNLDWIPLANRMQNAIVAYGKYIIKTLWPQDLAVLYPFSLAIPLWQVILSAMTILLISAVAIGARRRYPYLAVGWCWFMVTLLPVIGLIQAGNQSMADRYTYLPLVGLFIVVAWGVPPLLERPAIALAKRGLPGREVMLGLLATAVILTAATVTWKQAGYWHDNFSLYHHTLEVTANNYVIHYNLGVAFGRVGNREEAIREFTKTVILKPDNTKVRNLLAATLAETGNIDGAITQYSRSLAFNPNDHEARSALEYWRGQQVNRVESSK
jgi:hypothetical protein